MFGEETLACVRGANTMTLLAIEGARLKVNFLVYYEIDQQTAKTVLRLDEYNGDQDGSWVLLEAEGAGASGV